MPKRTNMALRKSFVFRDERNRINRRDARIQAPWPTSTKGGGFQPLAQLRKKVTWRGFLLRDGKSVQRSQTLRASRERCPVEIARLIHDHAGPHEHGAAVIKHAFSATGSQLEYA